MKRIEAGTSVHRFRATLVDSIAISIVVLAAIGSIAFVNYSMARIRDALPAEVLQQQRDIAAIAQELDRLAHNLELASVAAPDTQSSPVDAAVQALAQRLSAIRRDYTFDSLTGASAAHALVNPAVQDIERWMQSGVTGLPADSPLVLQVASRRATDTASQLRSLQERTDQSAFALLEAEGQRIERLRASLVIFILLLGGVSTLVVGLLVRQRRIQAKLAVEHDRLTDSMESMEQAFALFDHDQRLVVCNQRYRELYAEAGIEVHTGESSNALMHKAIEFGLVAAIGDTTRDLMAFYLSNLQQAGKNFEVQWHDGRHFRVSKHSTHEGGVICVFTDVTDFKQAQRKMEYLATHDALTDLPGRRHFERTLSRSINHASRHDHSITVMFIDVDRFKWINDTYGHVAGDRFLGVLSTRLRECVRDHDLVARLGGDEFAIILEETGDWRDISASAERVLDTLSAPVKLAGAEVRGTVSVGIATFPQDGRELSELVKHADDACYHAKALGRANYQFYTEAINLQAARRDKVEDRLRRALQRDLLQVHYQPQVVVGSQEVSGLEALLRWTDDELGAVAPTELVAVAEDAGLSGIVVSRVLSQVADDIRVWVERDLVPPRVWLNASASQLAYLDVAVEQIMESQRLGEDALGVEITESMLVDDPSRAGQALRKLNGLGVKLAIDDFGIGYSSLSALKDYPLDALKIDASFVRNVSENPHDVQIVRAVVSLAHGLGLKVVAEGVETAQQLQTLSEHEVDEIQGHLVSEALPAASVGEWLDHHSFRAASLRS